MAEGHSWDGASHARSNHPALAPPREGFSSLHPLLIQGGECSLALMSPCTAGR